MLCALLPLYNLRFAYLAAGNPEYFDRWIVWLEFGPVFVLLLGEWWLHRRTRPARVRPELDAAT